MGVWCDSQLEGQKLFWDRRSRLSDGRTGEAGVGWGWYWSWKYLCWCWSEEAVGLDEGRLEGSLRGVRRGMGAGWQWLGPEMVDWKVINQWTTKQHSVTNSTPQQPSTGHPQPPSQ